ncbi:hypothetical protein [Micromonospora rubida]
MRLGEHHRAVTAHRRATADDAWRLLPAEHRASHLIDITRAHLDRPPRRRPSPDHRRRHRPPQRPGYAPPLAPP